MRVAFYAPLKPPTHSRPSGDRTVARLLLAALERGGHAVELASRLRSFVGDGDAGRQATVAAAGAAEAERLIRRYRRGARRARPEAWVTYHAYYKAPDWIGPRVAGALAIPYVLVEASHAPKRATGPWAPGHLQTEICIAGADLVLVMNPADRPCLAGLLGGGRRLMDLPPFLDVHAMPPTADRARTRRRLARRHRLDESVPWLLAVGMMRPGDKVRSYRMLAQALRRVRTYRWQLVVVGAGEARAAVRGAFEIFGRRVTFVGALAARQLAHYYAAADLFVWPAIGEAYGMALLEAQANGLPAVAGRAGGVAQIVRHGRTGLLVPEGDVPGFARALARLLDRPERRTAMGAAARRKAAAHHDIDSAAARLDAALRRLAGGRRA